MAYRRLVDVQKQPISSSQLLAIGNIMERLDVSLQGASFARDDTRLVADEYRAAARSMSTASREAGAFLANAQETNAQGAKGPDAFAPCTRTTTARSRAWAWRAASTIATA